MTFKTVVERAWAENQLVSVLLELTYRCNLDCSFCYNDLSLRGEPLSLDDYELLLADLADLRVFNVTLSGGEPLAHPDFFAIGARARELGFVVRVKSNGHALRGVLLRRLIDEVDPFQVEVSLHGGRAETHDRQTRVPGSFDRLVANLREMREAGLRVRINSTLTRWNEGEIEAMFAIADETGMPLHFDPEVTPRDNGDRSPLEISATHQGILRLFELQKQRAAALAELEPGSDGGPSLVPVAVGRQDAELMSPTSSPKKYCGAGSGALAVDPFGNVYPCVQWRRPVGNLHNRRVHELWRSPVLDEVRDLGVEIRERLGALGERGARMAFCPGNAETYTGDPRAVYPTAESRADLVEEWLERDREAPSRSLPVLS